MQSKVGSDLTGHMEICESRVVTGKKQSDFHEHKKKLDYHIVLPCSHHWCFLPLCHLGFVQTLRFCCFIQKTRMKVNRKYPTQIWVLLSYHWVNFILGAHKTQYSPDKSDNISLLIDLVHSATDCCE